MKIERMEEETDKEWNERLTAETTLANNTETTKYFIERDPTDETQFIIHYVGEDGLVWKEHPNGPFNAKQVLEWRKKAEKYDAINWNAIRATLDEKIECEQKLEAVTEWFTENGPFHCDVHDLIGLRKILEAEG